jgi:hypothetical protein
LELTEIDNCAKWQFVAGVLGMGRRAEFAPVKTEDGWMVSVPAGMSATGRRVRRFFGDDYRKAQRFAAQIKSAYHLGQRGNLIPGALALDAAAAAQILEPFGISLLEAARMVAARKGAEMDTQTLQKRYDAMMAMEEMRWSDRYRIDMEKVPKWVGQKLLRMRCGEITEPMILASLQENGATATSTVKMRRLRVMSVINWKPDRHSGRETTIQILTPRHAAAVLRACETPDQRRAVALLLFAGIRPDAEHGEISRLQWEDVGTEDIYVSPAVSKVGDRHVPITPRLRRLIRGHPAAGPVRPAGWKRTWQRIRKAAGIGDMQDVTRHTFASNFLAAFGEDAAKQAMGHTAGSTVIFRHYRRAVTEAAGKKYFSVFKQSARRSGRPKTKTHRSSFAPE